MKLVEGSGYLSYGMMCTRTAEIDFIYNTSLSTFGPCFKLKKDPVLEDPVVEARGEVLGRYIN